MNSVNLKTDSINCKKTAETSGEMVADLLWRKIQKKDRGGSDMLPPSRTLKYKTYLGVFLWTEKVRLIQY